MSDLRRLLFANQTREYTGYPLVISRSVALRYLKQYQIYGNSEQDGTPTPENPVEVISVGDRIIPAGYQELEYLQSDGESYLIVPYRANNKTVFYCRYNEIRNGPQTANAVFGVTDFPEPSNANYGILRLTGATFNRMGWGNNITGSVINVTAPKSFNTWYEVLYDRNELYQDGTLYATSTTPNDTEWAANYDLGIFARNSSSVTMPAIAKISSVWAKENGEYKVNLVPAKRNSDNVLGMYDTVSQTFFVNQGTGTFTAGPEVSNYQIPVVAQGKNLFDKDTALVGYMINDSGQVVTDNGSACSGEFIPVKPNTSYTYSCIGRERDSYYTRIHFYNVNKEWIKMGAKSNKGAISTNCTTEADTAYIKVSGSIETGVVQFEEGSVATPYAPYGHSTTPIYLNAPLRKVGDTYADVLDYKKGQIIRNVGVKVLDGTENWSGTAVSAAYGLLGLTANASISRRVICTHLKSADTIPDVGAREGYMILSAAGEIYACVAETFTTQALWKQYLAAQYANGTPVTVYYPLATPVTESIVAPALPTMAGSTTYTTDTEVKPSNMKGVF